MTTLNSIRDRIKSPTTGSPSQPKVLALVLLSVCLSGLSTFLVFVNILYTRGITQKQFPTLVQTTSGETIQIGFEDPRYRSPETIKKYTSDTLYYLMTMTSFGPGEGDVSLLDPTRDKAPSMKVEGGEITQAAWLASESLDGKFSDSFKTQLAQMTPPTVFKGTEEIILKFNYIEEPVKVNDAKGEWTGEWTVNVIADLKVFRMGARAGQIETDSIPFNKQVTVSSINAPPVHSVEKFGELAIALNQIQLSGLQITDIRDLSVAN